MNQKSEIRDQRTEGDQTFLTSDFEPLTSVDAVIEQMRQFTVVCKVALQLGLVGYGKAQRAHFKVAETGKREFGLTKQETMICLGRARTFLEETFHVLQKAA